MRGDRGVFAVLGLCIMVLVGVLGLPSRGAAQLANPFLGSVPTGQATGATLDLSLSEAFAREGLAGIGRGRNENRSRRLGRFQAIEQRLCSEDFADGNGVNPNRVAVRR